MPLLKNLSDNEKKIFSSKDETQKIKFLGLQFAAKEAVVKALGTGLKTHDAEPNISFTK